MILNLPKTHNNSNGQQKGSKTQDVIRAAGMRPPSIFIIFTLVLTPGSWASPVEIGVESASTLLPNSNSSSRLRETQLPLFLTPLKFNVCSNRSGVCCVSSVRKRAITTILRRQFTRYGSIVSRVTDGEQKYI